MPASFDDLLNQILSSNPNLGRDQLITMVEQKKQESHGLLSDEGAIRLVAQQLSMSPLPTVGFADQRISSVHAGLNNSTITGQIIMVGDVREFQRSDGSQGKVLRMKVGDTSGQITCVFWDDRAQDVLAVGEGSLVLIQDHWVTERNGMVYVNVGSKSSVSKQSADFVAETPVSSIVSVRPGPILWTISGKVIERGEVREIETRECRRTRFSNIKLEA